MFVEIDNSPRTYAWGSIHAIAELLGRPASGSPEAELWFGAHPVNPSRIVEPKLTGGFVDVATWIEADPAGALGDLTTLPFLMKVLAAASALSIQVHPSVDEARAGFAREDSAGIALAAPTRNYKDASHKPELIYCVSETFDALCGFRRPSDSRRVIERLVSDGRSLGLETSALERLSAELAKSETNVLGTVSLLLSNEWEYKDEIVTQLTDISEVVGPTDPIDTDAATVRLLAAEHPRDPGIALALLMNRMTLRRGEALFIPHGILHAYICGLGVEVMAASDNVLRGGLTKKHVDVAELLRVGTFTPTQPLIIEPHELGPGVTLFSPGAQEFELLHVMGAGVASVAQMRIDGPAIALCTAGNGHLRGRHGVTSVRRGQAFFVTPDEETIRAEGDVELFVTRTGR